MLVGSAGRLKNGRLRKLDGERKNQIVREPCCIMDRDYDDDDNNDDPFFDQISNKRNR